MLLGVAWFVGIPCLGRPSLGCNARKAVAALGPLSHRTQTGRRGHQQRHHEVSVAHVAQQTRNSPKSPAANRRDHEVGDRGGFLGVGSHFGHSRRTGQEQHPPQPHARPTPQSSRRCHQNRRSIERSLGDHRRVQDPYSDSNQKRRGPERHMGRDRP